MNYLVAGILLCLSLPNIVWADESARVTFQSEFSASVLDNSGLPGWTNREAGKLIRADSRSNWQALIDLKVRLTDTTELRGTAVAQPDGPLLGGTEMFLNWRPVPSGPIRHQFRFGMIYPPISLENDGPGWRSPYTRSFSAINTWIAEEVRVLGFEAEHSAKFSWLNRWHRLRMNWAAFRNNDPAGSLLAWKGWSIHNRQTRWRDTLPLSPLPSISAGGQFENQDRSVAPFAELDDRTGYYVGLDWSQGSNFRLNYLHYDNRAIPTLLENGQYGWRTKFDSLGLSIKLYGVNLLSQHLMGTTAMGPGGDTGPAVDLNYDATYLLLSKRWGNTRFTLRRDWFSVDDRDNHPWDPSGERGNGWTVAAQHALNNHLSLELEWLSIKTNRDSWPLLGSPAERKESQASLTAVYRFGRQD